MCNKFLQTLKEAYFDVKIRNVELGVSEESILEEVRHRWKRGQLYDDEFEDFVAFVEDANRLLYDSNYVTNRHKTKRRANYEYK